MKKLYGPEAAARAGVAHSTWRAYCSERDGKPAYGPPPDGHDIVGAYVRPWWKPRTIDRWLAKRPRNPRDPQR